MGGDFNVIRSHKEKEGGSPSLDNSTNHFNNFTAANSLIEPFYSIGKFTWNNKQSRDRRILEKLDRFLISTKWLEQGIPTQTEVLPFARSDHWPIAISIETTTKRRGSPFQFERIWLSDPQFSELVEQWWREDNHFYDTQMYIFAVKLKSLKGKIKQWNKNTFGFISETKLAIEQELALLEGRLQFDKDDSLLEQEHALLN